VKPRMLPDWFAPVFAWVITILMFAAVLNPPYDANVNRPMIWLPPLLAVAWTFGWAGMARFKKKFTAEHEALGSPQLFGSPHEGRYWNFAAFLFTFRFLRLRDAALSLCFSVFVGFTILGMIWLLSLFAKTA
jgi:hypothetical protein